MAQEIGRRDFLRYGALAAVGPEAGRQPRVRPSAPAAIEEVSLDALREALGDGRLSARAVTDACLARIDALDREGPTLRAVIEVNPEERAAADALDAARAEGERAGPLHGMPILLKDNIDTADRMTTTAGSLALRGSIPSADAHVAERLRAAGAVLIGKANLSEWANFRSTRSSSGWSARGGQCRNPYALDRNPCGSSSGSAVAVAASLVPAAIGTETDGSIVCPGSANGIVGIKPTVGLVSRAGIIPIAHSQDTAGPMTRSVRDAAIVLGVLAGPDPRDPATADSETRGLRDYTPYLDADGLAGARIGVARGFAGFHEHVDGLLAGAVDAMRARGAEIVDPVALSHTRAALARAEVEVLLHEFKADLNAYLDGLGQDAPVRSLAEVIEFNRRHADEEMPYFRQERLEAAEARGPLSEPAYLAARRAARRLSREDGIDRVMDEHGLDAIVAPTGGPAWVTDLVNGDHFGGSSSAYAAVAGYPNITVPAGHVFGLPVGISFFGRAWSEPTLIRIAYAFEQATRRRRPPRYLPTAELGV
ncbi:MAG: amidase [Acidobacteria bacterium]|nr:amidase [Acidobacteriota bacterium]